MSAEIQRNRSPNSPPITLEFAMQKTDELYGKIGRASVKVIIAAQALGYAGISGSSLSLLGALNQYDLVDRTKGEVKVSALAHQILHPINELNRVNSIRQAALAPKIFAEVHEKWSEMDEGLLANQLIHRGFTAEGAKRCAAVYKANYSLAKLGTKVVDLNEVGENITDSSKKSPPFDPKTPVSENEGNGPKEILTEKPKKNMLATFKIPIGSAEAELIFTGERLEPSDFDALSDYVALFKKQYERKIQSEVKITIPKPPPVELSSP